MSAIPKNKSDIILRAALEQFAENGFHSSPVSQLANIAGVGVGSIYRYFKDKDELIHAVFAMVDTALQKGMDTPSDSSLSDQQQFIQLITNLIHYLNAHPWDFKFLEQYYSSPYSIQTKRATFSDEDSTEPVNPFVKFFSGGTRGTIKELPLSLYLAMIFGPATFLLRNSLSGLVTIDDELIQQTAEASWNAIKL
jgi:AcrR family transcriptional regulator